MASTEHRVRLREQGGDAAFRHQLFVAERLPELLTLGWPTARAEAMADMQYHGFLAHLDQPGLEERTWYLDDEPVGHLVLATRASEVRIVWVAVARAVRGRGIAGQMLAPVLADAREAGLPVTLHVDPTNTAARALYARLGFHEAPGGESAVDLFLSTSGSL